jgi:methyl-accepting chemotaxis protein
MSKRTSPAERRGTSDGGYRFGLAGRIAVAFMALLVLAYVGFAYYASRMRAIAAGMASSAETLSRANKFITTSSLVFAAGLIAGALALMYVVNRLTAPVRTASLMVRDIAEGEGDLTKRLEIQSSDEAGDLAAWFNEFADKLQEIMRSVAESAYEVGATSQELSATSEESSAISQQIAVTMQQVAKGSQDQSVSASNSAAAVAELAQAIQTVAEGTEEQAAHVQTAAGVTERQGQSLNEVLSILERVALVTSSNTESAAKGTESVRAVMENTQRIGQSTAEVSARVGELNDLSKEIRSIVSVIADIASQTNLLALNAAIEAARAGEYGRGFAVVADEVRGLAERSSQETKTIGGLIQKIGQAIEKAVASMEAGTRDVATGQGLAREAGSSLEAIFRSASEAKDMVASLIASSQALQESGATTTQAITQIVEIAERNASVVSDMASNSEEVKRLIDAVAATSEESAAAAEEVSASTEEMNKTIGQVSDAAQRLAAMADSLQQIVKRFKV